MKAFKFCALLLAATTLLSGCESGGDDDDNDIDSDIDGTWFLTSVSPSDPGSWYATFEEDGTWYIKDTLESGRHVYGEYKTNGNSFSGTMINPGTGTGEINGTFTDDTMTFNFVEFWHSPKKVITFSGVEL